MTDKLREAAQLALEAIERLEEITPKTGYTALVMRDATKKCRAALAQQDAQAVDFDDAYASTMMALVEDYAKAVHDGDDAACSVLRQTIQGSLEQADPTPPAQRVELTLEEISEAALSAGCNPDYDDGALVVRVARAVIEAYERKNGMR